MEGVGRLLVSCTDRPGIVAALSQFLRDRGANILQSDQHTTDPEGGVLHADRVPARRGGERGEFERRDRRRGRRALGMDWRMYYAARRKRVAIFVSRYDHCLDELLWR